MPDKGINLNQIQYPLLWVIQISLKQASSQVATKTLEKEKEEKRISLHHSQEGWVSSPQYTGWGEIKQATIAIVLLEQNVRRNVKSTFFATEWSPLQYTDLTTCLPSQGSRTNQLFLPLLPYIRGVVMSLIISYQLVPPLHVCISCTVMFNDSGDI